MYDAAAGLLPAFKAFDATGDNNITHEDFRRFFEKADVNNNGMLSREEFAAAVQRAQVAGALQDLVGTMWGRIVASLRRHGSLLERCEISMRPRWGALRSPCGRAGDALELRCGVLGACSGVGASLGPRGEL